MRVKVNKNPVVVPGFRFSGVSCGIKPSRKKDIALIVSDRPATATAAFTTNQIKGAPVLLGLERMKPGQLQAVVVNSGIANVSTGEPGLRLARNMCRLVGRRLGIDEGLVLPSSTGKIGVLPPWEKIRPGIIEACDTLSPKGFWDALAGMMTTDAFPKAVVRRLQVGGKTVTLAGLAKGAGMINPNMATMLCYVVTDAAVEADALGRTLAATLGDSFNAISVDGDTSTSDTLVLLANGLAGNRPITQAGRNFRPFTTAVGEVLCELARLCVKDGEGATRVVDIFVRGTKTDEDARQIARTVASSPLVKTAFFGGDPNWGRIACAVGYAGVPLDQTKLNIAVGDILIGRRGLSTGPPNEQRAAAVMQQPEFSVTIDLRGGKGRAHVVTSDLSTGYVHFNSAYST